METRIDGRDGWIEVTHEGVHVLAKGDEELRQRLTAALEGAREDSPTDVVTDELTTGGVRRAPDFAILDEPEGRVLVRGNASVRLTDATGGTREVLAPARGPWTDEDLDGDVTLAVLAAVATEAEAAPAPAPAAESGSAAPSGPGGWSMPSVFAAKGTASSSQRPAEDLGPSLSVVPGAPGEGGTDPQEPEAATPAGVGPEGPGAPADSGEVVESPAPEAQGILDPQPATDEEAPAGPAAAALEERASEDDDELPSFDFLFGNTGHHRSSLLSALDEEEQQEPGAIDSGPVAAAGGYQPKEDPTNTTLAPPAEDEGVTEGGEPPDEEHGPEDAPAGPLPGGVPPMPGTVGARDPESADEDAGAPAVPIDVAGPAAPLPAEEGTGPEPGEDRPQFADGHLVSSRVPRGDGADGAGPVAHPPGEHQALVQDGMISSVPWGESAAGPGREAAGAATGMPSTDPAPAEEGVVDTGELPAGPMVLAVRCGSGHHNAPHATRCRVCGQDLPTQQPEQTPRPSLGLLRLSTGDVVPLDRGILIGRAPRAGAEASGARAPHLVRIASPDNEISRNHVEVLLDGWHVLVRDLGSTNGTTVALPGSSPVRVRPGDQQTIEPGTTITLADQVSMVFEVTG